MFQTLFFILIFSVTIFATSVREILPFDTVTIKNITFEKYSEDYIIKNRGVLVLENCTFRNNELGSKDSKAIFSSDKIVAPVINYGKVSLINCKFINNYSWNTAVSDGLKAQAAAGAIANFGELNISNVTFENNAYQKGYFTIIRDENIEQFSYIGNDTIYNFGDISIQNIANTQNSGFQMSAALLENPVKEKAEIIVSTNMSARIEISIIDAVGKVVFTSSGDNTAGAKKYTWNLRNAAGVKVSSGTYHLKVVANNGFDAKFDILYIGVKE